MSRANELLKRVARMKVKSSRGDELLRRVKDLKARGQVQGQMLTRAEFFSQRQLLGLDLFAGAGGFTIGALNASCPVLGIQSAPRAVQTSRAAGHQVVEMDVGALGGAEAGAIPLDVMIGGPPCQPFSAAGQGKGRYDPRDGFGLVLDAVKVWKPRRLVMENVGAFLWDKHRSYREEIYAGLRESFKHVGVWKLNSKDWGVPQDRWRVFIWGAEVPLQPPVPTHGPGTGQPYATVKDALPELLKEGLEAIMYFQNTATSRELANPSPTVTGRRNLYAVREAGLTYRGASSIARPYRILTPDEAQVLQAFPASFDFRGNMKERQIQIGNAVPPPLAAAVVTMVTLGLKPRRHTPTEILNALDKQYDVWVIEPRPWTDAALIGVTNAHPQADLTHVPQGKKKFIPVYDAYKLNNAVYDAAFETAAEQAGVGLQRFMQDPAMQQARLNAQYMALDYIGTDKVSRYVPDSPIVIPTSTFAELGVPLAAALLPPEERLDLLLKRIAEKEGISDYDHLTDRLAEVMAQHFEFGEF